MLTVLSQSIMPKLSFLVVGLSIVTAGLAQTPRADFSLPETVCKGENIFFQNNSNNANHYFWDFCEGDLAQMPVATTIDSDPMIDGANNISVVESEGKFYGFVTSRYDGKLIRLDFGNDLDNEPQLVDLGNVSGSWEEPIAVEVVQSEGNWYGFLVDFKSFELFRLNFGISLENAPSVELVEQNILDKPLATDLVQENGDLILQIANFGNGNISSFNFGNSPVNVPSLFDYNITSRPIGGIDFMKENGMWYGLATEFRDRFGRVLKLKYSNGLSSTPTIEAVNSGGIVSDKHLSGISLAKDGGIIYGFVQVWRSGELFRLSFADGIDQHPLAENLGTLGFLVNAWGLKFIEIENESTLKLFSVKTTGQIFRIEFPYDCSATQVISNSITPGQISFNQPGTYPITLTAYDEFGNRDDTTQFITVTADQAPSINFQSDQCFGSTSTLTATADQTLSSANWSITDEANTTVTRTGQNVTYDFPTPGTYEVTLEVKSTNGCGNRLTKEVTIYEPPVPSFTVPTGQVCSNGAVNFTNTTDARGADDLITYRWFVIDPGKNETLVSEEANPAITFAAGGTHTVRLEAGIPGCTETVEQTIDILQGPTVSFTVPTVCQSNAVTFENQTVGAGITGYFWEFGDGGTYSSVTADNPTYTFNTPGTYPVTLRVTNALGCQNVYRQDVTVYAQPTVSFLSEVACVGSPTQFTDASTAGANANVSAWQWDFGDGIGTASTRNPTYAYPQAGTYAVKLITASTAGCVDSTVQTITVQSAVDVGFAAVRQCPTEARPLNVLLSDTSVAAAGETIDRWFWTVNGENFVSDEVEYAFPAPGDYLVSLTVFTASGCNATAQRVVSVTTSPAVAFTSTGSCTGEPVMFQGAIDATGWGELTYTWDVASPEGQQVGTAATANAEFTFDAPGTYDVTLTVQTDGGCTFTTTQPVTIAATPVAAFTASADYGGTPLEVTFANATTDATTYAWDFGGVGTSEVAEPTFTFTEVGTYAVTLTATNAAGCVSTTQHTVEVVLPVQDLRLDDFTVADSPTGDGQQLVLTLSNRGTRVASGVMVTVDLDETLTVEERLEKPLLPGQTVVYVTKFRLPTQQRNQQRPLRYLCARIAATDADFAEAQLDNNRNCLSLNEQLNVEPPFPNPAREQLRVSVILPAAEVVSLRLLNQDGRVVRTHRQEATVVGLNSFLLNVQGLSVGAYLLQVSYRDVQRQFRVAVGR